MRVRFPSPAPSRKSRSGQVPAAFNLDRARPRRAVRATRPPARASRSRRSCWSSWALRTSRTNSPPTPLPRPTRHKPAHCATSSRPARMSHARSSTPPASYTGPSRKPREPSRPKPPPSSATTAPRPRQPKNRPVRADAQRERDELHTATNARLAALEDTRAALRIRAERAETNLDTPPTARPPALEDPRAALRTRAERAETNLDTARAELAGLKTKAPHGSMHSPRATHDRDPGGFTGTHGHSRAR